MWPEALVHYFFAASSNDSFARMALGYRHMQGLGVPRSCQTAVLYYQPVAEEVVELAQTPDSLPFVSVPTPSHLPTPLHIATHDAIVMLVVVDASMGFVDNTKCT